MNAITIVQPETVIRWHRTGFRLYWSWKSRSRGDRPKVPMEIRHLIREMSLANRLWGAPRIHSELLKLGIEVEQSTVAKYMARSGRGRSPTWKTFFHNHAADIAAMDFLIVPTVGCRIFAIRIDGPRLAAEWLAHLVDVAQRAKAVEPKQEGNAATVVPLWRDAIEDLDSKSPLVVATTRGGG